MSQRQKATGPGGEPGAWRRKKRKLIAQDSTADRGQQPDPGDLPGWALHYANQGVPVFPCKWWLGYGSKAPLTPPPGHKAASTDPAQIADWWIRWPMALIGSPVPPNRCVIDIDPRNGGTLERLQELIQATLSPTLTVYRC
jgi:hypothetical protein